MAAPLSPDFRPQYHQLHRVGRPGVWRSLVGSVLVLVLVFALVPLVAGLVAFALLMAAGRDADSAQAALDVTQEATPTGLALLNVVIAMAIPVTFLVTWWLHRLKPRWVSSVMPRLRWRYLLACLGVSFVALLASLLVGLLLPLRARRGAGRRGQRVHHPHPRLPDRHPAADPAAGGGGGVPLPRLPHPGVRLAGVGTSRLAGPGGPRSRAHLRAVPRLSQDVPVFFDRFAFGVVAGILVIRTGGLEAGIAMHVLNNFLAFGLALAFGDLTSALNATGGSSWWMILSTLTQSLVYLALASWVARAMGLVNEGPPVGGVLPPPTGHPELVGQPPRV